MNNVADNTGDRASLLDRFLRFCIEQKLVVFLAALLVVGWGIAVAPFDWEIDWLPRDPVAVDAIPDLGENQQIVFTDWPGRSPQDVEDQLTYPLTVSLMGVPGVEEVRSQSMFGFSMIFVVFSDDIDFYWSRARIIEKLDSLPPDTLPEGVNPALGPDATALGQIYWYRLQGRDPEGNPVGGWDLDELRSVQDWYVRYGLLAAEGIAEVASIGGFVSEYQVDVDPDALRAHQLTLNDVLDAVRKSNLDVGARVTEINQVEYLVRGRGFIEDLADIEQAVVAATDEYIPVRVGDVATVGRGPAQRRGALTYGGAEAVGGVAVVRHGYNPLQAINNVKSQIDEISPGLPARAVIDWDRIDTESVEQFAADHDFSAFASGAINHEVWVEWLRATPREHWPEWVTLSQLHIEPFYDRTDLIYETLGTLNDALVQQVLVTVVVVMLLLIHLRSALVISSMLPLAVLIAFIFMKLVGVEANVVALAGIAIAIGTIVDMGLIVTENIVRHLERAPPTMPRLEVVYDGTREVGSAVLTAILTTIVSFLPVFALTGQQGKLFVPLAYTKTFVLIGSILIALTVVPAAAHLLIAGRIDRAALKRWLMAGVALAAIAAFTFALAMGWTYAWLAALLLLLVALWQIASDALPAAVRRAGIVSVNLAAAALVGYLLASVWEPLGPAHGIARNFLFVLIVIGGIVGLFWLFMQFYENILRLCLRFKTAFLAIPLLLIVTGLAVFLGIEHVIVLGIAAALLMLIALALLFEIAHALRNRETSRRTTAITVACLALLLALVASGVTYAATYHRNAIQDSRAWTAMVQQFPGLGHDTMPAFDEGSFLWMPTLAYHGSIGEALNILKHQDKAIAAVPEVEEVAGKIGRAESALDPAPVGMIESIINYKPEYITDDAGRRVNFKYDRERQTFVRDEDGELIEDPAGRPYRQWRDHIRTPRDIWDELAEAADLPGVTSAPQLQPIETRLVMLQSGMRAAKGLKLRAPDLETLERMTAQLEQILRRVPKIDGPTVQADRPVGKPYLEMHPNREAIARYGLNVADVQEAFAAAVGGMTVTDTVEGRERYPVRVRYQRERRQDIQDMEQVLVATAQGNHVPLRELAEIEYRRGPQMIRSEDTFLTAFITFSGQADVPAVEVITAARELLRHHIEAGELRLPAGVSYRFAGQYEQHVEAMNILRVIIPVSLAIIFLILYLQFRSIITSLIVFSGIAVAWAGGFIMIYLYGQPWFADVELLGENLRELFNIGQINLTVAVWVGFLALFGIAVDDGVVMATYLRQNFRGKGIQSVTAIREAVVHAGLRRVRPCLMTSATTILALLPVLTSTGRGADLMQPMAIPSVGGMSFVLLTMFTVPVLYCLAEEVKLRMGLTS